ncbi:transforming acidic coiled-coil-containing protein 1 isoform X2 [Oncorhynchus keta]|uniref:transforming acidic coiled-coil-containing protein 1 isoform X2 n=1 Tax=Oncorhynchus keta TaxID=8018 RepID=UPI00227D6941|nr:transforming acidic coiled-coil-containing protein 1 isoform X2 [Oncorhynchus keta]
MSWLSPMSWAKWTWTAVRGAEEGEEVEEEDGLLPCGGQREEEEEERSQGCSSDSEGHFETPEAQSPVHTPLQVPEELETFTTDRADALEEEDEQLIVSGPARDPAPSLLFNQNMGQAKPPLVPEEEAPVDSKEGPQTLPNTTDTAEVQPAIAGPSAQTNGAAKATASLDLGLPEEDRPLATSLDLGLPEEDRPLATSLDLGLTEEERPLATSRDLGLTEEDRPLATSLDLGLTEEDRPLATSLDLGLPEEDRPLATSLDLDLTKEASITKTLCNGHPIETIPEPQAKPTKTTPPSLKIKGAFSRASAQRDGDSDITLVPKASYNFNPDQFDDSFNPFASGGSKIQNFSPADALPTMESLPVPSSLPTMESLPVPSSLPTLGSLPVPSSLPTMESLPVPSSLPTLGSLPVPSSLPTLGSLPVPSSLPTLGSLPVPSSLPTLGSLPVPSSLPTLGSLPVPNSLPTLGSLPVPSSLPTLGSLPVPSSLPTLGSLPVPSSLPTLGSLPVPSSLPTLGSLPVPSSLPTLGSLPVPSSLPTLGSLPVPSSLPTLGSLPVPSSLPTLGSLPVPSSLPTLGSLPVYSSSPPLSGTSSSPKMDVEEVKDSASEASEEPKPVEIEFGLDEAGKVKKTQPRRMGKTPGSKLAVKKPRAKATITVLAPTPAPEPVIAHPVVEPVSETTSEPHSMPGPSLSLDNVPIPKSTYKFGPNQWDDPNLIPFWGGGVKISSSPVLPKGSYSFDPHNFDNYVDPFKPSTALGCENSTSRDTPLPPPAEEAVKPKLERLLDEGKRMCQTPKKSKDRIITNSCKIKKYENHSLVLNVCNQEEDVVVSQVQEMPRRVRHATDEEKLACSEIMGQKAKEEAGVEVEEEEDSVCAKDPTKGLAITNNVKSQAMLDGPQARITHNMKEKDICISSEEVSITPRPKLIGCKGHDDKGSPSSMDTISLNEMDKAAVLTLIREEIITKEIEANEWKRKYEDSHMEVLEMRRIVVEYEKTVAQMIEDEQHKRSVLGSQKSVQQVTLERDQALADLNSVERSLSDLFRRYENMKTILEGFKKNEEVLKKCAQEYLVRVRQEEQRYHTLKVHAEEKLVKANEDIAQVRSKADSESVALHASLRKEQMKVDSLERALHQKNQEIEELTKICDELIAKLGTSD